MWIRTISAGQRFRVTLDRLDGYVQDRTSGAFPWGTFVVNLTGCLLLGVLIGFGLNHDLDPTVRTVIGTGGIGTFTTFSTFTFETVRLAEQGAINQALRNALGSLIAGIAAASAGLAIGTVI